MVIASDAVATRELNMEDVIVVETSAMGENSFRWTEAASDVQHTVEHKA